MKIQIKPKARVDLLAIRSWGETHWGPARSREFLEGLIETIESLDAFPLKGRARPEFHANLRSIRYQGHTIFYAIENDRPVIVALLHERRNHAALNFAGRIDDQE